MIRPAAVVHAAAYHEAGHAVASWRQGDGIGMVSIEPRTDLETGAFTRGRFTLLRGGDRSAASGWGHRHLVTLVAGAVAQRKYDPRSCVWSCAAEDFRSARAFAAVMARSHEAERALLTWAQAEARALIAADWHLVEVVTHALVIGITIDGVSAMAILDAADRESPRTCSHDRASSYPRPAPNGLAAVQASGFGGRPHPCIPEKDDLEIEENEEHLS